jgi:hypothetical protein
MHLLPHGCLLLLLLLTYSSMARSADVRAFATAVDISAPTSVNTFSCYRQSRFLTAFVRIYMPAGSGQIDLQSPDTIRNAFAGE